MRTIYPLALLLLICNYKSLSQSKDMHCTPPQLEDDRKLEYDRASDNHIKVEDFNLLRYIIGE